MALDWILIRKFSDAPIGAVGFIDDKAAIVVAFFDDRDANKDGKVSVGERIASMISPLSIKGGGVVEVAMQARVEPDVILRDPGFVTMSAQLFVNFARGLVLDGIYAAYFARGVKMTAAGISLSVTSSKIKGFAIRKGLETAAKEAFKAAVGR